MFNEISIDLNEVEDYVTSDKFTQFLLNTTTNFGTAAFVLQEVMNAVQRAKAGARNEVIDEKFYKVSESELLELLANSSELQYLEAAGVDNWSGYGELKEEILSDWGYDTDLDWHDIAEIEIEGYEEI